jgi:hypothetical protein
MYQSAVRRGNMKESGGADLTELTHRGAGAAVSTESTESPAKLENVFTHRTFPSLPQFVPVESVIVVRWWGILFGILAPANLAKIYPGTFVLLARSRVHVTSCAVDFGTWALSHMADIASARIWHVHHRNARPTE